MSSHNCVFVYERQATENSKEILALYYETYQLLMTGFTSRQRVSGSRLQSKQHCSRLHMWKKPAMQINQFGSSDHSLSGELTIKRPKRKFSKWQMPSDQRNVIKLHLVMVMQGKCITVIDYSITHTWASLDDNGMTKTASLRRFIFHISSVNNQVQSGCSWRQSLWLLTRKRLIRKRADELLTDKAAPNWRRTFPWTALIIPAQLAT